MLVSQLFITSRSMVELILPKYLRLESIEDLGAVFRSPWKPKRIPLLGALRAGPYSCGALLTAVAGAVLGSRLLTW